MPEGHSRGLIELINAALSHSEPPMGDRFDAWPATAQSFA
jgi:hypothetical protein